LAEQGNIGPKNSDLKKISKKSGLDVTFAPI